MSTMTADETYNEASEPRSGGHMNDESFNGYANRETWAFNLHWSNDEGLYRDVLEYARDYMDGLMSDDPDQEVSDLRIGEAVVEYLEERTDLRYWRDEVGVPMPELFWLMREDVGSFWRVDRARVGEAVREALGIED